MLAWSFISQKVIFTLLQLFKRRERLPEDAAEAGYGRNNATRDAAMSKLGVFLISVIFITGAVLGMADARADVYKYIDANGVPHFVDSPSKIPPEYRDAEQVQQIQNKYLAAPALPPPTPDFSLPKAWQKPGAGDFQEWKTPVAIIGEQVLVPVILGYGGREVHANLLLDTGASTLLLDHRFSNQLAIRKFVKSTGRVADGRLITTDTAQLDYVRIGPFQVPDLAAAFIQSNGAAAVHDGLLGMNFLRHFNYSIDFAQRTITWKP